MRRALTLGGPFLILLVGLLWLVGALDAVAPLVKDAQRATQDRLAAAIRALRSGQPGALVAFWAVCFGYGVLHAAGPGHGKMLIGGYGVARRVPLARLVGLALASSLAQAAVAVGLVYALVAVLGLTRLAVEGTAERWMTPFSHAMIAGLGLWLVWRGIKGLRRRVASSGAEAGGHHDHDHHHDHPHDDHVHGPDCNHAHGPSLDEVARVSSWKDALALITGIAVRPCSGALFILILTWQLGIALAGIVGAFVMGIGTALVTMGVALLAVWAREGAFAGLGSGKAARVIPWLELAVGGVIAVAALGLLFQAL
jgi:ABC-type nickel/cobalt efflux system permease component RcnA